jgi:hypothetical protein
MKTIVANELKERWVQNPPSGWIAEDEIDLLSPKERRLLGYRPLVDVVLTHQKTMQKLFIEIEISRADPVANHAKFASAHLLNSFDFQDAFVSLVSNHVQKGHANLAAHTIYLLRAAGIRAFQMPLLSDLPGNVICQINQGLLPVSTLPTPALSEVIELTCPVSESDNDQIYYVTNCLEAILNLVQWNHDINTAKGKFAWGKRRLKYLLYDPKTGLFAPSKFCAFTKIRKPSTVGDNSLSATSMSIEVYSQIPQNQSIFDGQKAWKRLSALGFKKIAGKDANDQIRSHFAAWHKANLSTLTVEPCGWEVLVCQ